MISEIHVWSVDANDKCQLDAKSIFYFLDPPMETGIMKNIPSYIDHCSFKFFKRVSRSVPSTNTPNFEE
jgi:hypothetical protein